LVKPSMTCINAYLGSSSCKSNLIRYNALFNRHVYVAIWVWVINLQDTVNVMYIGVKTPEAGVIIMQAGMQAGVSIIYAWVKDMQAHIILRLELQKIISAGAFIQNTDKMS
jgi:hypothetical protein